jgi:hypothetical protein
LLECGVDQTLFRGFAAERSSRSSLFGFRCCGP